MRQLNNILESLPQAARNSTNRVLYLAIIFESKAMVNSLSYS